MRKMYSCTVFVLALFSISLGYSQTSQCSPNCNDLNASVMTGPNGLEFHAKINWTDIVTNFDCAMPVTYTLLTNSGTQMASGSSDDVGNEVYFLIDDVCRFLNDGVKIRITNEQGSCWSNITFKKDVPTIVGRRITVYCDNPIVGDPNSLINGVPPTAFVPCQGLATPKFVADWVFPRDCNNGIQDTAKQILREWEFFDKEGNRASAFDTIDVLLFPQITTDHIYCGDKDTVYCCEPNGGIGPFITFDSLNTGICDTAYLVLIKDEDNDGMLEFYPQIFDEKCGLSVHVDYHKFDSDCEINYKISLDIKQSCYGVPQTTCLVSPPAGVGPNIAEEIAPGYWRCTFWLTDLDTVPPLSACKFDKVNPDLIFWSAVSDAAVGYAPNTHCFDTTQGAPIIVVPTNTHECAGHTYIPPLCIYDDWSGVKQAKATIPGFGSWILTPNGDTCIIYNDDSIPVKGYCYESHTQVRLPKSEEPYQILYEIYDNCHNIDTEYCYLYVKDLTKPVPVLDKGVTVSLGEKKAWVDAKSFDEGSWDNCGVNLILARRKDWAEACIELCDSVRACCATDHYDTLRMAFLEEDKHVDAVEAHYAKTLDWFRNDNVACGNLIYNSWQYALMKYATLNCVDHPYPVGDEYFREVFLECYEDYLYDNVNGTTMFDINPEEPVEYCFDRWAFIDPYLNPGCEQHLLNNTQGGLIGLNSIDALLESERALISTYEAIGGGWAEEVVFSCEDACSFVTVEVLVMDYWCNWAKAWTNVWVEDQVPAQVVKEVVDETITCKSFRDKRYDYPGEEHPVSLEFIVDLAKKGDVASLGLLDEVFGSYVKAWADPYGNYVDIDGHPVETEIEFYDSICYCTSEVVPYRIYDDHLGYIWVDSLITNCYYEADTNIFWNGIVAANCSENVHCEQRVWCDIDHCGEGYIYREFKIWHGCPDSVYLADSLRHPVDTLVRHQRIYIGNQCELNKYMFDVPTDVTVYSCGVDYDPAGSGNLIGIAGPENTGYATYKFDDDCRLVGIAHSDKVFKITGGQEACYKVLRTWYFADWCGIGGEPAGGNHWWYDRDLVIDSCIQKILIFDTIAPSCTVIAPVEDGGSIEFSSCDYDLSVLVSSEDDCGLTTCYWELKQIDTGTSNLVDSGVGELKGVDSTTFQIESEDLLPGTYHLKVRIQDECNNESYCEYTFTLVSVKRPSPVCVTSLTADIIPWDSDQDGIADSAHAVVWAYEFDQSSQAPCGQDAATLKYYIEYKRDDSDIFDPDRVADSLVLTCADLGTKMVRMWVVATDGSNDYCDVLLVVQNNSGACDSNLGDAGSILGNIEDEIGQMVQSVQVMAESEQAISNISSGENGSFQFDAPMGASVRITPFKNINVKNGITTADLVQMLNHVSGATPLPTPYRRLAADVTRDGNIDALDMLELRQIILGDLDRFTASDSWRFIAKDYQFATNTPESEDIPDFIQFELDQPTMKGDFIGMKMGDMDMDNDPGKRAPRTGSNLIFTTPDRKLLTGITYDIPLSATQFEAVAGFQYTLVFDDQAIKLLDFEVHDLSYMDRTNFGVNHMSEGLLTTSWNATSDGVDADWGQNIFTVKVQAKKDVLLSEAMTIGNRITPAESYHKGKTNGVALEFDALNLGDEIELYQNTPNPAKEQTNIQFYLPQPMDIQLIVQDLSGKMIRTIKGPYTAGMHSISFETDQIPPAEVYFYSLITSEKVITKKMVFVR